MYVTLRRSYNMIINSLLHVNWLSGEAHIGNRKKWSKTMDLHLRKKDVRCKKKTFLAIFIPFFNYLKSLMTSNVLSIHLNPNTWNHKFNCNWRANTHPKTVLRLPSAVRAQKHPVFNLTFTPSEKKTTRHALKLLKKHPAWQDGLWPASDGGGDKQHQKPTF